MSMWFKYYYKKINSFIRIVTNNPWQAFKFVIFVILRAILIGWEEGQVAYSWFYFGISSTAKVNLGEWFKAYIKAKYIACLESMNLF